MKVISAKKSRVRVAFAAAAVFVIGISSGALAATELLYQQTNLTSNQPDVAPNTDPNLQNAWGVTFLPASVFPGGSPFWVSDNNSGLSTLYNQLERWSRPPSIFPAPRPIPGAHRPASSPI